MESSNDLEVTFELKIKNTGITIQSFCVKNNCIIEESCDEGKAKFLNFPFSKNGHSEITAINVEAKKEIQIIQIESASVFEIQAGHTYRLVLRSGVKIIVFTVDLKY